MLNGNVTHTIITLTLFLVIQADLPYWQQTIRSYYNHVCKSHISVEEKVLVNHNKNLLPSEYLQKSLHNSHKFMRSSFAMFVFFFFFFFFFVSMT